MNTPPDRYTLAKSKKNGSRFVMLDMTGATVAVFQDGFHPKEFERIVRACNEHAALHTQTTAQAGVIGKMREALTKCDRAFAAWQVGQIPGRPEDILALIVEVRAALLLAQKEGGK